MNALEPAVLGKTNILKAALQALKNYGLTAEIDREQPLLGRTRADALVRIGYGTHDPALYVVEVKRWLTPTNVGAVVAHLRTLGPNTLLITDYATPQVAEKLKELDVAFADAAGNAYLRGPNFLIWLTGRRQPDTQKPTRAGRAWQPTGLKLIFALLCNPDWIAFDYRKLAAQAGVANGTVGWVMRELVEQGFVIQARRRTIPRRLHNRRKLLDRWVEIYTGTYRATTLLGRYQAEKPDWWRTLDAGKYGIQIGGEPAGAILTDYLKPGIVTIYVNGLPGALMVDHRLRAAPDGNVEIRQRFWTFEYEWDHRDLTPPVLVYADLLATGDARCIETAQRVYDDYLARLFAEN